MNARKVLLLTAAFLAFSSSASAYWYPAPPPYPRYYYYPYAYPIYAPPRYYVVPGYRYFYTPVLPARPIIVERYYPAEPPPPKYTYEERSYAQITPAPKPEPRPAPPPASRLERQTLSARELFAFDKAELRKPQPKLDEIASVLVRNPQIGNVTITGYTDRIGSDAYNQTLSQRRANAVKSYLVGKGVPASRLTAVGKGKSNPVVECHDKDRAALIKCLEPNRRVEVEQITVERRY